MGRLTRDADDAETAVLEYLNLILGRIRAFDEHCNAVAEVAQYKAFVDVDEELLGEADSSQPF